jgi:hypothetical protein
MKNTTKDNLRSLNQMMLKHFDNLKKSHSSFLHDKTEYLYKTLINLKNFSNKKDNPGYLICTGLTLMIMHQLIETGTLPLFKDSFVLAFNNDQVQELLVESKYSFSSSFIDFEDSSKSFKINTYSTDAGLESFEKLSQKKFQKKLQSLKL